MLVEIETQGMERHRNGLAPIDELSGRSAQPLIRRVNGPIMVSRR